MADSRIRYARGGWWLRHAIPVRIRRFEPQVTIHTPRPLVLFLHLQIGRRGPLPGAPGQEAPDQRPSDPPAAELRIRDQVEEADPRPVRHGEPEWVRKMRADLRKAERMAEHWFRMYMVVRKQRAESVAGDVVWGCLVAMSVASAALMVYGFFS